MLESKLKFLQAVLNLPIDDSVFILLGRLLKILAPKNPNVFLPASDFTFGSNKLWSVIQTFKVCILYDQMVKFHPNI